MCDACAHHSTKNRGMKKVRDIPVDDRVHDRLHNNPPNPIDDALEPFGDTITEAEGWLDGKPVETEGQMKAVDALTKEIKAAKKAVEAAEESAAKPIYDQWKAEKAKFAPTITDLDRIVKGLVAAVDVFKRKLAAEKEAARKKAEAEAWEATRKAQESARMADASNIEAQRQAAAAQAQAEAAQKAAMAAKNDTVKGMRWYDCYEIIDHRKALHWIAANDRDAMTAFIEAYVAKNAKRMPEDAVRNYKEQRAI